MRAANDNLIQRKLAYFWLFFWTGMMIAHGAFGATFEVTPITGTGHRQECHSNSRHQLVCRTCWHEAGKVRCGQPRIVR